MEIYHNINVQENVFNMFAGLNCINLNVTIMIVIEKCLSLTLLYMLGLLNVNVTYKHVLARKKAMQPQIGLQHQHTRHAKTIA